MVYRKAIFVVTYSKNKKDIKYLILKRKLHWKGWEFPKGGLEKRENIKSAIIREVKEETGQKPIIIKKFNFKGKYKYNKVFSDRRGIIGQTFALYSAEIKKKRIKIDRLEHSGYKWVDYKSALKKLTWGNQRKCLKIVNTFLEKSFSKKPNQRKCLKIVNSYLKDV